MALLSLIKNNLVQPNQRRQWGERWGGNQQQQQEQGQEPAQRAGRAQEADQKQAEDKGHGGETRIENTFKIFNLYWIFNTILHKERLV